MIDYILSMQWFNAIYHVMRRFRYPVSLPEDVALALGMQMPRLLSFNEVIFSLKQPDFSQSTLVKFMPRALAEQAFVNAVRTERFFEKTLISYCFNEGCIEFALHFDKESRLRRVYLLHKEIPADQGIEIALKPTSSMH